MTATGVINRKTRWVYLTELSCYGIGYYDTERSQWVCHIPLCYAPFDLLDKHREWIARDTTHITVVMQQEGEHQLDITKLIPGNAVVIELHEAQNDWVHLRLEPPKIIIDGKTIYGASMTDKPVWTPVTPDMGEIDIYSSPGAIIKQLAKRYGLSDGSFT